VKDFLPNQNFLPSECETIMTDPILWDSSVNKNRVVLSAVDLGKGGFYGIFQSIFLFRVIDFEFQDIGRIMNVFWFHEF